MALFFSSLRGLPHFGGKPKDDAIFDISKNGRQPGARPQSTLVERDPLRSDNDNASEKATEKLNSGLNSKNSSLIQNCPVF